MKLPLRYFLLGCLLLGAIGVPWGWRAYERWKQAETERARTELQDVANDLLYHRLMAQAEGSDAAKEEQERRKPEERGEALRDRLKKLTGRRPEIPPPEFPSFDEPKEGQMFQL